MQASPSKARAQALETHAWSLVTSWLSKLYHPAPIPTFERNAATLRGLQSLMAENTAADKLRELVYEAQCEELQEARAHATAAADQPGAGLGAEELLQLLESSLSEAAASALDSLARSAVLLGCETTSPTAGTIDQALRSRILGVSQEIFALEAQIRSLNEHISRLEAPQQAQSQDRHHQQQIPLDHDDPETGTTTLPSTTDISTIHAQTLQHQRETKQLSLKAQEYRSRLAQLTRQLSQLSQSQTSRPTMSTVAAKISHLERRQQDLQSLENTIRAFHGLPPDVQASREEVRRATAELGRLRSRRDELFERLGSGSGSGSVVSGAV
ncbi:uncharacterized protein A1O9_00832 [Exophiala aquamarina CBS 119918]|uniref:HAUS augmin-like complex subunit 1 n=1 Tax=Exophiala aquamarina CBS 119918 TaxID=1182545 RepID=A0A072PRZ6_9EURO|nr:uncharacterized protein A1O9_00832 [Exophiala aquamarina CBS 119918]KEF62859.1 hypothetical protein A1O9_00832 [Exophiala aquamarina CBS 119918]